MSVSTFYLNNNRISLIHPGWEIEHFDVGDSSFDLLNQLGERYQQALIMKFGREKVLLDIGLELGLWLNKTAWLERLLEQVNAIWNVSFRVNRRMKESDSWFLNAPWELLAFDGVHLATDINVRFNPLRQIGEPTTPFTPEPYRLSLIFMAAAPDKVGALAYEKEELAILTATRNSGIDLVVEETGTLAELAAEVSFHRPDVVHVSCHGGFDNGNPILLLEDEEGGQICISATDWLGQPSLSNKITFISACHTADPSTQLSDSFATQLIRGGTPAVLGWGSAVHDVEATNFAQYFYQFLSQNQPLSQAFAAARWHLFTKTKPSSKDWHLARLFLGNYQIDTVAKGGRARRLLDAEFGAKAFLDKNKLVPVAGKDEFVGRRRPLQAIIRHFRRPDNYAGVLIHGMGRQGKSSLAARVARRFVEHQTFVVYGHYSAIDILQAFRDLSSEVNAIISKYQSLVLNNPSILSEALQQLLKQDIPFILVIDDLEQILIEPNQKDGLYTVSSDVQEAMRAVLRSFKQWGGQSSSRLLLTSRYKFFIADTDGHNLADCLLHWHLSPMDDTEQLKQLEQKQIALDTSEKRQFNLPLDLQKDFLKLASGNPGLQNQLYILIRNDMQLAKQTLNEMEKWLKGEQASIPDEKTRDLLEGLVLDKLHGLLSESSQELLQWSQDFVMPLPLKALGALASEQAIQSLLTLGLWDGWRDDETNQPAAMLNKLAKRLCQDLNDEQKQEIAQKLLVPLWTVWQPVQRSYQADYQLTRLAVRVSDAAVLQDVAGNGVAWVCVLAQEKKSFTEGRALGLKSIACLESENITPDNILLRYTAESCHSTGEVDKALQLHQRRLELVDNEHDSAVAYSGVADILMQQGQIDEALDIYQQKLLPIFENLKNEQQYAVVQGRIADILEARGQLDEALRIRQEEELPVYERLGYVREKAVTMGKIADILEARGQLDEALRIRQEEQLPVYERLGDVRSKAVTMGKIADILQARGQLDEALRIRQEELLPVFERLGDVRSKAVTMGKIADILQARGQLDEALRIRQEEQLPVYERLGDVREKAVTMGKIADILQARGQLDEALRIRQEEELPVFERLGDVRSKAVTMGKIADILQARGQLDEALRINKEVLIVFEHLGDVKQIAVTQGVIADILQARGQLDEALRIRQEEQLPVYERLGDVRSKAVTMGQIADILQARGQLDEALRIQRRRVNCF
jgi:tetratricopeptide (TPR) repeat protein